MSVWIGVSTLQKSSFEIFHIIQYAPFVMARRTFCTSEVLFSCYIGVGCHFFLVNYFSQYLEGIMIK